MDGVLYIEVKTLWMLNLYTIHENTAPVWTDASLFPCIATNPKSENSKLYISIIITSHLETESEPSSEIMFIKQEWKGIL
jgi:hypothetical protein